MHAVVLGVLVAIFYLVSNVPASAPTIAASGVSAAEFSGPASPPESVEQHEIRISGDCHHVPGGNAEHSCHAGSVFLSPHSESPSERWNTRTPHPSPIELIRSLFVFAQLRPPQRAITIHV